MSVGATYSDHCWERRTSAGDSFQRSTSGMCATRAKRFTRQNRSPPLLTDLQQRGLLLDLTNAETLGVTTEPWHEYSGGWTRGPEPGPDLSIRYVCVSDATPEHYAARCWVYAEALAKLGMFATPEPDGSWIVGLASKWPVCTVLDLDPLTALVHALAAAEAVLGISPV